MKLGGMTIPDAPSYFSDGGVAIFLVTGANHGKRSVSGDIKVVTVHFTESASLDSREYLWQNPRGVSTTYLTGAWPDMYGGKPCAIKYMSEADDEPYTQGFGVLGMLAKYDHGPTFGVGGAELLTHIRNLNDVAIGIEIEGMPSKQPSMEVKLMTAQLTADIITYWHLHNRHEPLLCGHVHVDSEKQDPQFAEGWSWFAKQVYDRVRL
jgi:hypothetical protein